MPKKKKAKKIKKIKNIKKTNLSSKTKSVLKPVDKKSSNSSQDDKPEIKKIKKQPTEKRIYNLKDFVVYPKHGVGKITAIEKAKIGEIDIQFYKILVEKEKLTLTVPINQQSKLRPIASINQRCSICPKKLPSEVAVDMERGVHFFRCHCCVNPSALADAARQHSWPSVSG